MEIFSSVQGEGPHVGETTLFVRFGECDLRCGWCDSPQTWRPARQCRIEQSRGTGRFRERPNPVSLADVLDAAQALELTAHRFVSLTGGEPLLQPEAAAAFAAAFRARGPRILLETHGLAAEALVRVRPHVDVVSMDWKLASDVRRESDPAHGPVADFHDAHEAFLAAAASAPEVVIKLIVTPASADEELEEVWRRVAKTAPQATLILQPVTPTGRVREAPSAARLLALVARASRLVPDVRLIPQTHKTIGAL